VKFENSSVLILILVACRFEFSLNLGFALDVLNSFSDHQIIIEFYGHGVLLGFGLEGLAFE
jgi:hypothetical protein